MPIGEEILDSNSTLPQMLRNPPMEVFFSRSLLNQLELLTICDKLKTEMRIVQFISKKLTPEETRYHTTDREALAAARCLEE